ncbi:hypothetical protein C2S53_019523 [Perilla frutescens var. hirtella]|uniref:Uncharacterized protein n=1 Tax=Perilla frutescens var. hirtella TaxID=608512 RepID=A0AAD4IZ55_PERFH|nr:hypothetical protein C2S53_019523 [Perilla frutescens var. hirtella]
MSMKTRHFSADYSSTAFNHGKLSQKSQALLHNPPKSMPIFNSKHKLGFQHLRILHNHGNDDTRKFIVYSVEPGASPSGPPPNILSWVVAAAIAVVIPFISQKWGPLIKSKVESALQTAEDVAEAVEKVAGGVEKVAENIAENLPASGKLREAVDFVEKIAERTAKDAGAVDDFIDKVQEEEEKAKALAESRKDESEKPSGDSSKEEKTKDGN